MSEISDMHYLKSDSNCTCLCMWLVWFYALIFLILAHSDWRFIMDFRWGLRLYLDCCVQSFNMANTFSKTLVQTLELLKKLKNWSTKGTFICMFVCVCVSVFENVFSIPSLKSKWSIYILVQCCTKFSIWFSQQRKSEQTTYMMLYMISYEANLED